MEQEISGTIDTRELSFGEKLIGVSFNPSKSPSVDEVKFAASGLIDAIHNSEGRFDDSLPEVEDVRGLLFKEAKLKALEASMLAIRAITWQG